MSETLADIANQAAAAQATVVVDQTNQAIVTADLQQTSVVHIIEQRSFGRQSADQPMVVNTVITSWGN